MNETRDKDETTTAQDGGLDPREAAALLEESRRRAERSFALSSPLLSLIGAAVAFVAFGALWLSVRNQHPYKGPTAAGLGVLYGVLACWIIYVVRFRRRATAGLSGRSVRQERAFGAVVVVALVGVSVYQGVLKHDGASLAVVYGTYPPTAQLIVLGSIGALAAATREEWVPFGVGIWLALMASGSAFAGPRDVWLFDGVGCCLAVLGYAGAQAWMLRASR
jgi:hypothetical protein